MAQHTLLLCFLFTLMMIKLVVSKPPTFIYNVCSNTTMFDTNSRYQTNLNTVFHYLSSNATNPSGFHEALAGNGSNNVVYGHFVCRGDQTPSSCNDCVTKATTTDLPKTYCPNRKVAIIWYDECMVRYSNVSYFGTLDQNPITLILSNTQNVTGNISQFMDIMINMMSNMVTQAANGSPDKKYTTNYMPYTNGSPNKKYATNYVPYTNGSPNKKYATNYVPYTNGSPNKKYAMNYVPYTNGSSVRIYGMEQCTPDLSANDCYQCLVNAIGILPTSRGGRVIQPSCNVRFENYPFFNGAAYLTLSPPPPPSTSSSTGNNVPVQSPRRGKRKISTKVIAILVPLAILALALSAVIFRFFIRKLEKGDVAADQTGEDFTTLESLQYDLATLRSATDNFSDENKLGEGGFGSVYKGTLPNGEYVAVKRLSESSGQGAQEFKNELLVVAKLQHRNLARLLGFCLAGDEKMLIYEYAPNISLDNFLFDPLKQEQINWGMRYNIIHGIARGMLYLHQDSRLRIIHRDLKASNVLLDANMNPKISDFGMARMFGGDQSQSNTSRVVGTFGYMSPEYVMHGHFSAKSDVYSFGVLVLEIISGKRNSSFYESGYAEDLLSYAWKLWQEGTPLVFVDPSIRDSCSAHEVMRCVHLGLLCVQESVEARPTMETVVLSLDSSTVTLPVPRQPPYFSKTIGDSDIGKEMAFIRSSDGNSMSPSLNDVSVSEVSPR